MEEGAPDRGTRAVKQMAKTLGTRRKWFNAGAVLILNNQKKIDYLTGFLPGGCLLSGLVRLRQKLKFEQ